MKIVSHYLQSIDGIAIYPIIALIIFFVFFTLIILYTFTISKEEDRAMGSIPLESDDNESDEQS